MNKFICEVSKHWWECIWKYYINISLLNLRKKLILNLKEKNRDIEKLNFQSLFVCLVSCNDNDCNILFMKYVIDMLQIAK